MVDENGDAEWYTDELFSLTDKAQTEPADFTEGETPESKAQEEEDEDDPYVVYQSYHNEVNKQLFFSAGGRDGEFPGKFTPTHVEELEDNQIFVFGSNKDGEHESGTANRAFATFGAEWGVGEGLTGKCYAIPTKDGLLTMDDRLEERQTRFSEIPTREAFADACDEFWWVMKTFAEYTLREELLPAMFYLNNAVRGLLNRMIRWYLFLKAGGPVDMGILDSRMGEVLDADLFRLYRKTYPNAEYSQIWDAYGAAAALWKKTGQFVAERCGFEYPEKTEQDMAAFIQCLKEQKQDDDLKQRVQTDGVRK